MSYEPPFIITARSINLISEISAQMERFSIKVENDSGIKLRKINRMKTIRGSLAIEGNTLSEEQVTALIDGKHVVAPVKEVQEVRNAISAYEHFKEFDPYNVKDLLKAHSMMTLGLVDNPGHFRKGGVCVAGKDGISHIAPPADRVPFLIADLFEWLKNSKDHILIKSSVFHYEFEFIHPFEDGNGRMGRFWQSRLLSDWNAAFEHLPIENMIWENQAEYYKVIEKSTDSSDSGIFIEFMLQMISDAIQLHDKNDTVHDTVNDTVKLILSLLKENPSISYDELAAKTGKSRVTISRKLAELKKRNLIRRVGADKNGHWEVVKDEN
ncbi:MAG: Fic family protein [Treponema sp.]|nr:Fic family protein [Treponema sp.]